MEKCPITGKLCKQPKVYHVTEIENGAVSKAFSLCAHCFEAYVNNKPVEEKTPPPSPMLDQIKPQLADQFVEDMVAFVKQIVQNQHDIIPPTIPKEALKCCPNCNHTTMDIIKTGKLGCPYCYTAFEGELSNVIYATHAGPGSPEQLTHTGKKPKNWQPPAPPPENKKLTLIKLQYKMNLAVKEEDYEYAAKLRDQIKELEAED